MASPATRSSRASHEPLTDADACWYILNHLHHEVLRRPVDPALTATVGVEDHAVDVAATGGDRRLQGVGDEVVRMCSASDQPITRRENKSMTVARYSQPSPVRR